MQIAVAIAYGVGGDWSANQLMELIHEKGLPSLEEREQILEARRQGDNIADLDVDGEVDHGEDREPDEN